jgi:hypothetical protein
VSAGLRRSTFCFEAAGLGVWLKNTRTLGSPDFAKVRDLGTTVLERIQYKLSLTYREQFFNY